MRDLKDETLLILKKDLITLYEILNKFNKKKIFILLILMLLVIYHYLP